MRPTEILKCLKFPPLNLVDMHRRIRVFADEFLATVTEGLVHGVYKVVTRSSFNIMRVEVHGCFATVSQGGIQTSGGS